MVHGDFHGLSPSHGVNPFPLRSYGSSNLGGSSLEKNTALGTAVAVAELALKMRFV